MNEFLELWKSSWNRFWFTTRDAIVLGLMRVLVASMLLYNLAVWAVALGDFFGDGGVIPDDYRELLFGSSWSWSHLDWVSSSSLKSILHWLGILIVSLWLIGYKSRVTGWLSCLIAISYCNRAIGAMFGLDQILCFLCLYLAIGNSGNAFSLDRWLANRRAGQGGRFIESLVPHSPEKETWTNIATRLIQVHLCIVYLFAGLGKLQGETWWNGEAIWGAMASYEYQTLDMTWLAGHMWLVAVLTLVSVAWEVSYPFLVWQKLTRPLYLAIAVAVHLGIGLAMGMLTFGLIMIYANFAFLEPEWFRSRLGLNGESETDPPAA